MPLKLGRRCVNAASAIANKVLIAGHHLHVRETVHIPSRKRHHTARPSSLVQEIRHQRVRILLSAIKIEYRSPGLEVLVIDPETVRVRPVVAAVVVVLVGNIQNKCSMSRYFDMGICRNKRVQKTFYCLR